MLAIGMGISRFAYTPILPAMRAQAGLTPDLAGYLATGNYAGYLAGALWPLLMRRMALSLNPRRMLVLAMLLAFGTTLAMALSDHVAGWLALRSLAGLASAWLMIYASAIVLETSVKTQHHALLGIHYAGVGCGIVLSGALVVVLERWQVDWRGLWLGAGLLILALAPLVAPALGSAMPAPPVPGTRAAPHAAAPPAMRWLIAAYFCAGLGYIVSATFLPLIAKQQPQLASLASSGWVLVGIAAIPSNLLWSRIARGVGDWNALMLAFALQSAGVALPAWSATPAALLCSAAILGATFMGIVTIANGLARALAPLRSTEMIAAMTASYGVGQIAGPTLSGMLAGSAGDFSGGLWIAAASLVCGIVLLLRAARS